MIGFLNNREIFFGSLKGFRGGRCSLYGFSDDELVVGKYRNGN